MSSSRWVRDEGQARGVTARSVAGIAGWAVAGASLLLTILVLTAFEPLLPDPSFDGSWRYAVAGAAERSLAFGKDFVFTFGPLGMLYSGFRMPAQDALYLGFHILVSVGLFAGFFLSARPALRPYLIVLPIIVAAVLIQDAVFFVLPFTLLVGCGRRNLAKPAWVAGLMLIAAADGVLPLVKGTMSLPVAGCTLLAVGVLARKRLLWAIAVTAVTVGAALAAWMVSGQHMSDLPAYLRSQSEMTAGYTDAMSIDGPPGGVVAFLAFATVLTALWTAAASGAQRIATALGCALCCFVSFKAGFVRDDGHSLIAASALALLGTLLFLHDPSRRAVLGLALGIGGWAWIAHPNLDVSPKAVGSRFATAASASLRSIVRRARHPDLTFAGFEGEKAQIRDGFDFPDGGGTFDIYPVDQTLLLASGLPWAPRPVVQSYSAYSPVLTALNASHVEGPAAPDHLLFNVQSLDDRYPSLDDGASWPAILSHYDYAAFAGVFAHLKKSESQHPATIGAPFLRRSIAFDEEVVFSPDFPAAVWAVLDFHPSTLGRLASLLFKRPPIEIDVTYRSAQTKRYRMVAGMSAAGFLLSPTIASARDFVALKLADREILADKAVRSFRLHQETTYPFWGTQVDVTLAALAITPDPADSNDLRGSIAPGRPLAGIPSGGECSIDSVADQTPGDALIRIASPALAIEGWAMLSTEGKQENDGTRVALTDAAGDTFYAPSNKIGRPDVNAYFGLPPRSRVAFSSIADLRSLHGAYTIHVVQDGPRGPVVCPTEAAVVVP